MITKKSDPFKKYLFQEVIITMTYGNTYKGKIIDFNKLTLTFQTVVSENPFIFQSHYLEREEIDSVKILSKEEKKEKRIIYKEQTPFFEKFKKEDTNQS